MPAPKDLKNQRFGKLFVEGLGGSDRIGRRRWLCRCDCDAVVTPTTNDLTSGRHDACPACGGPQPERTTQRTCVICGQKFDGHPKSIICSNECRLARNRGRAIGELSAPPIIVVCVICGERFRRTRGLIECCSRPCLREKRRRKALADWKRRLARDPDLPKKMHQSRMRRRETDPVLTEKIRQWDAKRHKSHRERMNSDPEYAANHRQKIALFWIKNRRRLIAKRSARLDAMTPSELGEWLERTRRYSREWQRRKRAEMTPEQLQQQRDLYREYKRQRQRLRIAIEFSKLEEIAANERTGN